MRVASFPAASEFYQMKKIQFLSIVFLCSTVAGMAQKPKDTLRLATYTYAVNNRLDNLRPLAAHLGRVTGYPVIAVSYPTVKALLDAIAHDSVDIAVMNTLGYLVLQKNNPGIVKPMLNLQLRRKDVTDYGACIVASKKSNISSLSDIKNTQKKRSLALVGSSSTSGNLVPRLILNSNGIVSAEANFDVYYAGTHQKAMEDVLTGKTDLAGCGCAEVDSAKAKNNFEDKAVLVAAYNDIPLGPVVYRKGVSKKIIKRVSRELSQLHINNPAVFRNFCAGWTEFKEAVMFKPVNDRHYDAFRAMFGNNESIWKLIE